LDLLLGDQLGQGRTGFVYAVLPLSGPTGPMGSPPSLVLPPLAMKIGGRLMRGFIAREACIYDDIERLQGSVVPRCYGYFTADIPSGTRFIWETPSASASDKDHWKFSNRLDGYPINIDVIKNKISVLLLERLTGEIFPTNYTQDEKCADEVYDLFREISHRSIDHLDVAPRNIIRAMPPSPEYPHLPSHTLGKTFRYRIIDFEQSHKHNISFNYHFLQALFPEIEGMFEDLDRKRPVEAFPGGPRSTLVGSWPSSRAP
ncbi:hypothetical protein OF83DRAFT_1049573, partial [Amylostereum chailletii]